MKLMRKNGGFTLVELIVVIAILAILAGIAVPAYSGYIQKADKAADLQLLGAINQSFAAACLNEGANIAEITSASVSLSGGKVSAVSPYNDSFFTFYAGNKNTAFKVIESLVFDSAKHVFVDPTSVDSFTVSYNGNPITLPSSAVAAYKNSNWGNVASSDVLGLIGSVTDAASATDSTVFTAMMSDEDYLAACAATLGYSNVADYQAALGTMVGTAVQEYQLANPDATQDDIDAFADEYAGQVSMNTAVLVAAQNANANKANLIAMLTENDGKDAKTSIAAAMSSSPADGLAQASMAYGLYTSYMLNKDPNFDTSTNPDPLTVMNTLSDKDFQDYLKSDKATSDLDGFVSVLDAASKNTGNGVGADIVQNGFAENESMQDLMQQILGK